TRSLCDWSSDVCSSDLAVAELTIGEMFVAVGNGNFFRDEPDLLFDELIERFFFVEADLRAVPVDDGLFVFPGSEQRNLSDCYAGIEDDGLKHSLIVAKQAGDPVLVKDVGVVFELKPDFFAAIGDE